MEYKFREIEKKWQKHWKDTQIYETDNDSNKPKSYVLDMFPYPSGAGLHVGHPLGYIASDVYARYKRLKGYNVLHPMGFDAFGLPAEQYALETGQHPATTTDKNITTFKKQMDNIGFCFDWSREVRTSDPNYYHWTQWIFLKLFHSWYNRIEKKAQSIEKLINIFAKEGNKRHLCPGNEKMVFTTNQWKSFDEKQQQDILMNYRLAYSGVGEVNWCEALGTVLANDEVVNGVSERGGHLVVKKKLRQWYLRITEYADRLLDGLQQVDFSEAMKEMQSNWIGRSQGLEISFDVKAPSQPSPKGKEHTPSQPSKKGKENTPSQPSKKETPRSPQKEKSKEQVSYPGYQTAHKPLYHLTKEFSIQNRKKPTPEEKLLWEKLRKNQTGFHIRRQHIIGNAIVDFVCLKKKLTIEVDGGYHNNPDQQYYDEQRTQFLKDNGYEEMRFTNEEVRNNIDTVVGKIKEKLDSLPLIEKVLEKEAFPEGEGLDGALEENQELKVYTTRPDTIFGVDFMVLAPEHELIDQLKTTAQAEEIDNYVAYANSRSERERIAEKKITGCFTGAYAIHPFSGKEIPIWISEYVLSGYGTGAVMAVPCGDERDHRFAKHFNIPITNIIGDAYDGENANPTKEAILQNSDFLDGMKMADAISFITDKIEEKGFGQRKVNFKMRDASFSRQRYWGEPFPIQWKDGIAYPLDEKDLPLELPHVESYKPGPEGKGPLANISDWTDRKLETNTMPGYAGSSWYFLRYMDPQNPHEFASKKATDYWNQVDVYIGGTEHAVGHLLYSRLWTKVLYDLGYINFEEPYKKLINQGKITGDSRLVYRIHGTNKFVSKGLKNKYKTDTLHVNVSFVDGFELDTEAFKTWKPEFKDAEFLLEDGKYICGAAVEKMSKSLFNTVNPDAVVEEYGADTFRMYEMFLGPIEQSKPWDTKGIEGVSRFLKKLWRLFYDRDHQILTDENPTKEELKILHKTLKKVAEDSENFSFNTAVSQFMICVNELTTLKCHKKAILKPLIIALTPYAPHISEELWHNMGYKNSILDAAFPEYKEEYLKESNIQYPVAINGKTRTTLSFEVDADKKDIEKVVLADETVLKWIDGKPIRKFIFVKGRMINVVI